MLRAFLSWAALKLGLPVNSRFPDTSPAISDWLDRLPSGPADFDDAAEIECARHPCPYIEECAKRSKCLRAA